MAVQDPTKKKRDETIPKTGVYAPDYGATPAAGGGGGGVGTPATATPAPQVNRTLAAPRSIGTQIGQGVRSAAGFLEDNVRRMSNATIGGIEAAANAVNYPGRVAGGVVRDIGSAAITGAPSANEGQPLGDPLRLPRFAVGAQPVTSTPLNGRSGTAPVNRQLAGAPAPSPASPASPTAQPARGGVSTSNSGGSAGAGVIPASRPRGTIYNDGSGATYATSDGRIGQLPAGVAVVRQKDGTNAFGATGESVAAASGASAPAGLTRALAPPPRVAAVEVSQPSAPAVYGRSLNGDVSGAERERAAMLSNIDNQLLRIKPNTRGRREFIAELLGLKRQLTGQRVDQATTLASQGAQLDNTAAIEAAQLAQRTGESNANRSLEAQRINIGAQDSVAQRDAQGRGVNQLLVDRSGNTSLLRNDGSLETLTGADGKPFQPQQDPSITRSLTVSPDTQYKTLSDRLAQLQQFGPTEGQEDAYNKQVSDLQAQLKALESGGGGKTPLRTGMQDGRKVVQYSDGTIEYAE